MANANVTVAVKGVDATKAAFNSVKWRAKSTAASLKSMLGSAFAAAGAYIGGRKIIGTVQELGKLSDLSMKTGASVGELTKSATAFQTMGLDVDVNRLAKSFQVMNKNTGREGMKGFVQTLKDVAAITDPEKRGASMTKFFGDVGMEFRPLIDGGDEAISKFETLASIIPGISDAAANNGDAFADAMGFISQGASSMMGNAVGYICGLWADEFPGGVRAGALNAVNWVEYFAKTAYQKVTAFGAKAGGMFQAISNWAVNGYSWDDAWKEYGEMSAQIDNENGLRIQKLDAERASYVKKLKSLSVDDLANGLGKQGKFAGVTQEVGKMAKLKNDLIFAESNEMRKLVMSGPQLEKDKQQIDLLRKIADNTEKTADATQEAADAADAEYGTLNA